MNLKKKTEVILLPTKKAEDIPFLKNINGRGNKLYIATKGYYYTQSYLKEQQFEACHLYFLSDEPIKEGDWYFDYMYKLILQASKTSTHNSGNNYKKVIVTTDKSLNLPELPKEFIEVYVREYNKENNIQWVMVDYEGYECKNGHYMGFQTICSYPHCNEPNYPKLKLDKNNQITITKVKDTFSLKELKSAIYQAISYPETFVTGITCDDDKIDKWIENI